MLSRRQIQLIDFLEHKKIATGAEIAEKIRISKRTAIRDINQVNHILNGVATIVNEGHGYYLAVSNKEEFHQIKDSSGLDDELILLELVCHDYVTLDELTELMYQSKAALAEQISHLRQKYENRIKIGSKPNQGHYLDEPFVSRFILLANIIDQNPSYFCLKLSQNVSQYTKLVQAIREHINEIPYSYIHSAHLASLFLAAKLLAEKYEGEIGTDQPKDLIIYQLYSIAGIEIDVRAVAILKDFFERQVQRMARITPEYIGEVMQLLEQEYQINICSEELLVQLVEHLKRSLAYPQVFFGNRGFLLEEMKAIYPLAFDLSIQFVQLIFEKFQIDLYDIDLIGLYFSSAMTRDKQKSDKIILFSNQYAVANMNKLMLEQKIPDVEVLIVHGKSELMAAVKEKTSNLLINNQDDLLDLGIAGTITIVDVRQIIGSEDMQRIEATIKKINIQANLDHYFPDVELSALETSGADSWHDVVERTCKMLLAKEILLENEAQKIIEREKAGNNLVINCLAIPHCMTNRKQSFFAIFIHLTNAVTVDGERVHNMLIACTNSNIQEGIKVFNYLYHKLSVQESDSMLKLANYQQFIDLIK